MGTMRDRDDAALTALAWRSKAAQDARQDERKRYGSLGPASSARSLVGDSKAREEAEASWQRLVERKGEVPRKARQR